MCPLDPPPFFDFEQKLARVDFCKIMLKRFVNGTSRGVSDIITEDETWIYHYDPETKQQSKKVRHQQQKYAGLDL